MIPSYLKKSVYSAVTFFGTIVLLSVGYATLFGGLSTADKVSTGSGLTATSWNRIIDGVLDLDARTAPISASGGNIGIGTTNPGEKLEVNGNIKIYGQIMNDTWMNISVFSNNWTSYSPLVGVAVPSYRKDKIGRVSLRGCLTPGTWSTAAFILPVGYRPIVKMTVPLTAYSIGVANAVASYAWIFPDGTFNPWLGNSATWVCLDGISFPAD